MNLGRRERKMLNITLKKLAEQGQGKPVNYMIPSETVVQEFLQLRNKHRKSNDPIGLDQQRKNYENKFDFTLAMAVNKGYIQLFPDPFVPEEEHNLAAYELTEKGKEHYMQVGRA